MIALREPSEDALAAFVEVQGATGFSYAEVGATRDGNTPAGYRIDRRNERVGDANTWNALRSALEHWRMHRDAGVRVWPVEPVREGLTVALVVKAGVTMISACRVVYMIDEPDRFGFAYGTLADHPVSGEERFLLTRTADGVSLELLAFSRSRSLLFKLATPIARRKQLALGAAYVGALRRLTGA